MNLVSKIICSITIAVLIPTRYRDGQQRQITDGLHPDRSRTDEAGKVEEIFTTGIDYPIGSGFTGVVIDQVDRERPFFPRKAAAAASVVGVDEFGSMQRRIHGDYREARVAKNRGERGRIEATTGDPVLEDHHRPGPRLIRRHDQHWNLMRTHLNNAGVIASRKSIVGRIGSVLVNNAAVLPVSGDGCYPTGRPGRIPGIEGRQSDGALGKSRAVVVPNIDPRHVQQEIMHIGQTGHRQRSCDRSRSTGHGCRNRSIEDIGDALTGERIGHDDRIRIHSLSRQQLETLRHHRSDCVGKTIGGGIAGVLGDSVGHPVELVGANHRVAAEIEHATGHGDQDAPGKTSEGNIVGSTPGHLRLDHDLVLDAPGQTDGVIGVSL